MKREVSLGTPLYSTSGMALHETYCLSVFTNYLPIDLDLLAALDH